MAWNLKLRFCRQFRRPETISEAIAQKLAKLCTELGVAQHDWRVLTVDRLQEMER